MTDNDVQQPKQEVASLLVQYQQGMAHEKVSEELRDAVAAVQDQRKPAEVTIKIRITPVSKNQRVVETLITSSAKIPKPAPSPSMYFTDEEGTLHRNDPLQRSFDYPPATAQDGKSAAAGRD